jgi:hypothetical protein
MYLSEILDALSREGVRVRPWTIRHLIASRKIGTPRRDAVGRFDYTPAHLRAIRSTLKSRVGKPRRSDSTSGGGA